MLLEAPDPAKVGSRQNVALTCYLSAMLAMARSMREICSRAGLLYGDRLTRMPRRLGFDATVEKLEESRQALEADLAEYTAATAAWVDAGACMAQDIVAAIEALEPCIMESRNLHTAMLEDLARQMSLSAEVDADSEARASLRLYALGLRSYLQRRRVESGASLKDLQCRAEQLAQWLARADPSNSTDLATGVPNRDEFERRLEACWHTFRDISLLMFEWKEADPGTASSSSNAIAKQLADRLAGLVRPRDILGRWASHQFAVIFECPGKEAIQRAGRIAGELSGRYSVTVNGVVTTVEAGVTVSVMERLPEETKAQLIQRMNELQPVEPVELRNA